MNLGFLPTNNIYVFDNTVGTFSLTTEQFTILENDNIIIVDYEIMVKEMTGVGDAVIYDDYIATGAPIYAFKNKTYKLTWTSSTYTLELITSE